MPRQFFNARQLTPGAAHGPLLFSDCALSFWGGVAPATGEVIDRQHPLCGQRLGAQVLALPMGCGSCTGSSVLLELILNGHGPCALVLEQPDPILVLGSIVAELVFGQQLPIISVGPEVFAQLRQARWATIDPHGQLCIGSQDALQATATDAATDAIADTAQGWPALGALGATAAPSVALSPEDQAMLDGAQGRARQVAMQIVLRMAAFEGASGLMDVVQAHIDGCIYTGAASLQFAERLRDWGAKVKVATTLNAISVDQRRWRALGVDPALGEPASALAQAYVAMGASPSFTCAPYLLDSAPRAGEHIAWAESNAVVYANSVLAARSAKYADFLDICIALVARAPASGCHVTENRHARVQIMLPPQLDWERLDDAFYPLLGYWVGRLAGARIPVVCGLAAAPVPPSLDDLKAFGAAFATTSAAPMFHLLGITPEATTLDAALGPRPPEQLHQISHADLVQAWDALNGVAACDEPAQTGTATAIDLVALGNPHFSASECAKLARLCQGRQRSPATALVLTTSRAVYAKAAGQGDIARLEAFGVNILTDTCWCMLGAPIVPPGAPLSVMHGPSAPNNEAAARDEHTASSAPVDMALPGHQVRPLEGEAPQARQGWVKSTSTMTNSGKYAHYGPGLTARAVRFGTLAACVEAACTGFASWQRPVWLTPLAPVHTGPNDA